MRLILFAACLMLADSASAQCPGGVCPAPSFGYQQYQPQYMQPSYQPYQPVYRQQPYGGYGYYRQQFQPMYQPVRQMTYQAYQKPCDHWGPDGQVGYIEPQPGGDPYWYTR